MRYFTWPALAGLALLMGGCATMQRLPSTDRPVFREEVEFLTNHTQVVVLSSAAGDSLAAVLPDLQGRVITSTGGGPGGPSYGWINRRLIASGQPVKHMNPYGGEDRFWIGPEGGQFSVFFRPGAPFDLEHWQTPAPVDTESFELAVASRNRVLLRKDLRLENYSGTVFQLRVDREIRILERSQAAATLGLLPDKSLALAAFESNNRITNTGREPWERKSGLLSIWIVGMFNPAPEVTIVVPYVSGPELKLGPVVNDSYFGKVPPDRMRVGPRAIFFKGDGQVRGKIGLSPRRARPVLGSYDAANRVLTIVQYTKPEGPADYVNSMWEIQSDPFAGDTVNSYNDGPPAPGAPPLGPFYELETSSPAAALPPGKFLEHTHRTFHFEGPEPDLDRMARALLGVSLADIRAAFPP